MSQTVNLYERLTALGITLRHDNGQLRVRAAKGALDEALKAQLQLHKSGLLQLLTGEGENIPASEGQTRLWLWQQQHGGDAYHLALGLQLEGGLDASLFCQALNDEIAQHPALRMRLVETDQGLCQRCGNGLPAIVAQQAPSGTPQQWLQQLAAPAFDLANDVLLRAQLLREAEDRHVLLLVFHHSVIDGWSLGMLLNNVAQRYQGQLPPAENLPVYSPATDTRQADDWWEALLQDAEEPISFPPAVGQPQAGHSVLPVDGKLWSRLTALAERSGVSLHHWMNAAFQLLLARYYGKNDTVVLTPYANRNAIADARRVGFLVNTLYSRANMQPTQTLRELVLTLARQTQESLPHSHASYHHLRTRHPQAASNIMFSLESDAADQLALSGIHVSLVRYFPQQAKFDLMLTVVPGAQPQCLFEFRHGALTAQDVAIMAEAYLCLLQQIADDPDAALQTFRLQATAAVAQIPASPAGPLEQIARQVRQTPQATAVAQGRESWSYAQLWAKVGRVAQWLHQQGVQPGSSVGIGLPAGPAALAATLGVFAAGSAYVPLDRRQPVARLQAMIADAGLALVIDEETLPEGEISGEWSPWVTQPTDRAWLIFTSGSTGTPKAAIVHHAGVARLLAWYQQAVGNEEMRALVISNTAFDLTQKNLFAPLMCGGQVLFPCMEQFDPKAVLAAIIQHQVTVINCTPTAFISLLQEAKEQGYVALDSLRYVVLGGEPILLAPLRQWQQQRPTPCRFINSYGPTECADVVAWYLLASPVAQQHEPVPLGQAIPGALLSVVDHHGQPLPAGVSGELMIDGDSVGLGYHQRPDMTARQFLSGGAGINQRRYLTGDRAVLREDGNLYYLGRSDRQIKLNGYRIEIEEIEAALLATGLVDETAVALREDARGHALLAAFYCSAEVGLTESQLHDALAQRLPHYQVPARYVPLAAMPLTRSGKIDRNALPQTLPSPASATQTGILNAGLEQDIAEIWQTLLDCPVNDRDADFFALGGHSLLAMEVVRQIRRQLGIAASTGLMMQHPRLADFAAALAQLPTGHARTDHIDNHDPHAAHPLSAMQQRLWFLWRLHGASSEYSMSAAWRLDGALDTLRLQQALVALVARHPILGSRLIENPQGPHYHLDPQDGPIALEEYQVSEAEFPVFRHGFHTQPLDLARDRFIRFALVHTEPARHYLLVNLHHIAADGLSLPILLQDLQRAWLGSLPAEPAPQFAWLEQQRKAAYPLLRERWRSWLADAPQTSRFPTDSQPDSADEQDAGIQALSLAPEQWRQLKQQARQWSITPFVVLLSSWFILLQRYSRQQDLVFGIPVALRDDPDSAAVIGPLLNNIPLRVQCDGSLPLETMVRRVATAFDQAISGSALPFEEIVDAVNPLRDAKQSPLFQIQIVEDPVSLDELSLPGLAVTTCPTLSQQAKYDLNVHFQSQGAAFGGYIAYRQSLYGENTLVRLAQAWQQLIAAMLTSPGAVIDSLSLVSAAEFIAQQSEFSHEEPSLTTAQTLHGLFEAQVKRTPQATALVWEGGELSYAQLDSWANQLAHGLIASGLASGECVSVCLPRSAARIAVLYGVLKAGGMYLPIDPHWPVERQSLVRQQAQPAQHIDEQRLLTLAEGQPVVAVARHVDAQQCCYLMYTSGSTGIPKGVPIRHGGVAHDLLFLIRRLALGEGDRVLQLTSFSFDPAVRDQFATLASGAAAILPDDATATHPARILALMAAQQVSHVLSMVPTLLRALLAESCGAATLRVLMLNGERLRGDDLTAAWRAFGSNLTIINQYGPTEATMTSATHVATTQDESALTVPLGVANPNTQLLIMDEKGQPLPQGAVGEICIAGPGLSQGYLGQRSPEAFVWRTLPDGTRQRFYRSGDLGRWRNDGVLTFLGRMDFQVKLRGNRIEPGEIDACLGQLPEIRHCAVNVIGDERNPVLAAWIVENTPGTVQIEAVKQALMAKLPAYMVPSCFTLLSELPLTASGKVDRRRLPQQLPQQPQRKAKTGNATEQAIARVWQQLLELPTPPDCETNFFEMGANSLMMVQASERIGSALGDSLAVVDLFAHPTIRALSQFVMAKTPTVAPSPEINVNAARRRAAFTQARERRVPAQTQRNPS
ncbi:amino acid adenylation domain-containing protein [Dickeya sp. CFBP 2040]|uniref:non-ribosomal peptide synthetase n=1 Tax=Dickeya sp. CFBP 2040 TaxID=2718531 RepID=UPI001447FEAF|nr:non-ribosomal peptide synthetase [Dickeya sp. CFBP 2040]NKI73003.1 amino acid adenylation domain-containing protein [Dickeya sp. CFBP 2040]